MKVLNVGSITAMSTYTIGFFSVIGVISIIRHKENIQRLLAGTENRFEKKSKVQPKDEDK